MSDKFNQVASGERLAGFDADAAREEMGLSEEQFALLAGRAADEIGLRLEALRRGVREFDLAAVTLHSHTIKSVAASLGAEDVRRAAERLEQCARESARERCPRLLSSLETEVGGLLAFLGRP